MLILYRLIINVVCLFAPIILRIRIYKQKEDQNRYKEKLCIIKKKKPRGKLVWFHAASVGELLSIVPLLEKLEKIKEIKNPGDNVKKEHTWSPYLKTITGQNEVENIISNKFIKGLFKTDKLITVKSKNNKLVWKSNTYSKNERKQNPILYFASNEKYLIVADNIAKYYAININNGELIWYKNNTSPFNSQVKIFKDKFFVIELSRVFDVR